MEEIKELEDSEVKIKQEIIKFCKETTTDLLSQLSNSAPQREGNMSPIELVKHLTRVAEECSKSINNNVGNEHPIEVIGVGLFTDIAEKFSKQVELNDEKRIQLDKISSLKEETNLRIEAKTERLIELEKEMDIVLS